MLSLPTAIISVTFLLGVVLTLLGAFALVKRLGGGGGSLKIVGIEISGANGAALILLVGSAMTLSSFGWASTHQEVVQKTAEVQAKTEEVASLSQEKTVLAQDLVTVTKSYDEQRKLNQDLTARVGPVEALPEDLRTRLQAPAIQLSPLSREAIERLNSLNQ